MYKTAVYIHVKVKKNSKKSKDRIGNLDGHITLDGQMDIKLLLGLWSKRRQAKTATDQNGDTQTATNQNGDNSFAQKTKWRHAKSATGLMFACFPDY